MEFVKSEEPGLNPGSGSFNSCDTFDFRQNTNHLNPSCTCKHLGTKSEINKIVLNELVQMCSFGSNSLCPHGLYVASQAPPSMGFSQQEYWSVMPFPPPGDLPDPGIEPASFTSPALAGGFFTTSATWDALE